MLCSFIMEIVVWRVQCGDHLIPFLQEKRIWHKDKGRMCSHSIISWHKDEKITQEEAFAFGQEFAEKWFARFQTVIAVHQDRDHIHCHLVANSVSYEEGRKYHTSKKDL